MLEPIMFFGKEFYINPIAIELGSIKVYWYGIIIVFGIVLALYLLYCKLNHQKNNRKFNILKRRNKVEESYDFDFDTVVDFLIIAIVVGFISARIYYVLFNLKYYINHPLEIFMIWKGGIAIYGGVIGALVTGIIFCRKKKIDFLKFSDLLLPYLLLVQSIGRWGNFINREAYGYETNLPWKMGIYNTSINDYIYVHPTFLYESVLTFLSFIFLVNLSKNKKFDGQVFYLYFITYGIIRFFIEGLRTDSLMLANYRVSQVLSLIFVIFFGILYYIKAKGRRNLGRDS